MADSKVEVECHATNFLEICGQSEKQHCAKCPELEQQLQRVLEELSSVQQIVQILRTEYIHDTTLTQQVGSTLGRNDTWKTISSRGPKNHTKDNMELINHIDQIVTGNRYTILETVIDKPGNDTKLEDAQVHNLTDVNTKQLKNKVGTRRDCLIISKSQEEFNMRTKVQSNPRNPSRTCKQSL